MRCNERSDAIRCDEMRQPQPYLPIRIADRDRKDRSVSRHLPITVRVHAAKRTARRQLLMREAIREVIRANEMAAYQRTHLR